MDKNNPIDHIFEISNNEVLKIVDDKNINYITRVNGIFDYIFKGCVS